MDERDIAVVRIALLHLMRGKWFAAGREIIRAEENLNREFKSGAILKGLQGFGVSVNLKKRYIDRIIHTSRRILEERIAQNRVEGVSLSYVNKLLEFYDSKDLTRRELELLLFYRQIHFNNYHPSGMDVFKVTDKCKLQELLMLARICEPFMLLV